MISKVRYTLEGAYVNRAFQMSVQLVVKNTIFGTVKYNSTVIYNWIRNKFVNLQVPDNIRSYEKNRMGYEISVIYKPEEPYFCMKVSHPDSSIPGRIWTTEAEIIVVDEKVLFGVKLSYSTPINNDACSVEFSMPSFVVNIAKQNGIIDVRKLEAEAWSIEDEKSLEHLYDLIQNVDRKMPVIVITENDNCENIGGQYTKGYLVDADLLAREIASLAHVVRIPCNMVDKWNEVTGKKWGVYGGAIRTYFPGANFAEDDYMRHPLSVANRIMASNYMDKMGNEYIAGDAFKNILEENVKKYNTNVRFDWRNLGHKFYFYANKELLIEKEKSISNIEQLRATYERQISQLEESISDKDNELLTALIQVEEREEQIEEIQDRVYRLNLRIDVLEHQLACSRGDKIDIPILDDYSKLEEWVDTYFPGRIVLHNRAIRSLKNAVYENPELVFKSIHLLGTTYYQMRMGKLTKKEFEAKCSELGIEEAGAIADTAAGEQGDTYFVQYHGKKVKLDRHLRKGTSREPQFCMRIYFFWCEEESLVVIGSLPQHLSISIS